MKEHLFLLTSKENNLALRFFYKKGFKYSQEFFILAHKNFINSFLSRNFWCFLLKVCSLNCIWCLKIATFKSNFLKFNSNEHKFLLYIATYLQLKVSNLIALITISNNSLTKAFEAFYTCLMQFLNLSSKFLTMSFQIKERKGVYKNLNIKMVQSLMLLCTLTELDLLS